MLDIIRAVVLGIVQGLTEFIPVSSSAHLIIAESLFQAEFSSLIFDVVLHFGTLLALLVYYRQDILRFLRAAARPDPARRTLIYLLVATVPAVIAGFFLQDIVETTLRSLWVIVFMLVALAALMFVADRSGGDRKLEDMNLKDALIIGLSQALALVPGTSRSGSTIVAGSLLRFNNAVAAQFSFYLAIPVVFGANVRVAASEGMISAVAAEWQLYLIGSLVAAVSGYMVIGLLLRYLSKHSLALFAWYRIALAVLLSVMLIV